MDTLLKELRDVMRGDVRTDAGTRAMYARDTSIFERTPAIVVFPKDASDVVSAVRAVHDARLRGLDVSITARAAGSDMTGGPLTTSVALVCTTHMNHFSMTKPGEVMAEPGAFYRDFEAYTRKHGGYILPSYPASREICAIGGMIANNAGGELTLRYGKIDRYVRALDVVLADGSIATFAPLKRDELEEKKRLQNLEGSIYRGVSALLSEHSELIAAHRPHVSKNSAGYALWDVEDTEHGIFDLTKLIVGSQGTLALITNATLSLEKPKPHRSMLVIMLRDLGQLPEIVRRVLAHKPESFESYDDHTLRLAVRFFPQLLKHMGLRKLVGFAFSFLSEAFMVATGGVPKLILLAEFAEDTAKEAQRSATEARKEVTPLVSRTRIAKTEAAAAKYWAIRRESFALLRKKLKGLYPAPFIDDFVVDPHVYPQFLPELNAILDQHKLTYTVAGHIGNGNFHILPFIDMNTPEGRREILELGPKVYDLVVRYGGSLTGEHNDGIIRTPYLQTMFGQDMCNLFAEVKRVFDPWNILNPGKKVGGTIADIKQSMITHV